MKNISDVIHDLFISYENYKEKKINQRRFTQKHIAAILDELKAYSGISIQEAGKSVEGRSVFLVKVGTGPTKILLWSQMHGDEATATMALLDIFNFLKASDRFDELRGFLLKNLTLYFIPMLNPDGAEVFSRRNALNIDINRDALSLVSPEAQILKRVRDEIEPQFGFNLHDMDIRYAVGNTNQLATIAFLAPPVDFKDTITPAREKAMKVIVSLKELLENHIPGQIGKWSTEYEPRAFGDNIQKSGTSTILVESGGYKNDPEKQYIRKLNFILLMEAFKVIAENSYSNKDLKVYDDIPFNSKTYFNLIIRNASLKKNNQLFKVDIGINRYETGNTLQFTTKSIIEEVGDMRNFYGYEEFDAQGMEVIPGKLTPKALTMKNLKVQTSKVDQECLEINPTTQIAIDCAADFVLKTENEIKFAVVNGFLVKLSHL